MVEGLEHQKLHIIGHSIGAQLGGMIGGDVRQRTNGRRRVHRITGLDPAGPGFQSPGSPIPVNRADAFFNDNIHTSSRFLGYSRPTGDADFWPNDGSVAQPGCSGLLSSSELQKTNQ